MSKIEDLQGRFPGGLAHNSRTLHVEDVQLMVEAAIEDRGPEHEYVPDEGATCRYFDPVEGEEGQWVPGCVFGHAFSYLGVTAEYLADVNTDAIQMLNLMAFADDYATGYAKAVQDEQDGSVSWGEAKETADAILALARERRLPWADAAQAYVEENGL